MKYIVHSSSGLLKKLIGGICIISVGILGWYLVKKPVAIGDQAPLEKSFKLSFVDDNMRYAQDVWPEIQEVRMLELTGWKGETLNAQVLIWSDKPIKAIQVIPTELNGTKGNVLAKEIIGHAFVRYVLTDSYGEGCGEHAIDFNGTYTVPDPLDNTPASSMPGLSAMPIWISISLPPNIDADNYTGFIQVITDDKKTQLQIQIKVIDRTLPPPDHWSFDLDLWQHPAAIARIHQVPLWSTAHYDAMRPYYQKLASLGQKCITTGIIHEPWNHQTFDDYPSLIRWTKHYNDHWSYDYSLFDEYVSFVLSCGITGRINCYTMIPWKLSFGYYDEALAKDTFLLAEPGSTAYKKLWLPMLKDFAQHLKTKGWFDKTSISVDERPLKSMQVAISILHQADPDWKIALAGAYHPEIAHDVYDYSIASAWMFDSTILAKRKSEHKPSTFYTCCVEAFPNGYTFSPPAESTWLAWYAAAKDFTGYLRWAFNSWTVDPLKDSRFTSWPGGDTYQIYPGPRSSIRLEKLREGIQDYEKIQIILQDNSTSGIQRAEELKNFLTTINISELKQTKAQDMLQPGKKILNSE